MNEKDIELPDGAPDPNKEVLGKIDPCDDALLTFTSQEDYERTIEECHCKRIKIKARDPEKLHLLFDEEKLWRSDGYDDELKLDWTLNFHYWFKDRSNIWREE
jgi:hypothetical protein